MENSLLGMVRSMVRGLRRIRAWALLGIYCACCLCIVESRADAQQPVSGQIERRFVWRGIFFRFERRARWQIGPQQQPIPQQPIVPPSNVAPPYVQPGASQ